jgi:hypothetical protein
MVPISDSPFKTDFPWSLPFPDLLELEHGKLSKSSRPKILLVP